MNSPKHVEFYSKNKFEKLVHLVGFIIRIYQDARSPERQNRLDMRSQNAKNEAQKRNSMCINHNLQHQNKLRKEIARIFERNTKIES